MPESEISRRKIFSLGQLQGLEVVLANQVLDTLTDYATHGTVICGDDVIGILERAHLTDDQLSEVMQIATFGAVQQHRRMYPGEQLTNDVKRQIANYVGVVRYADDKLKERER